jgi:hypothetical protein
MDSTVCPHAAVAGTACALAVGAPVAAMTTVATDGALTISTAESAVAGLIRR